MPDTDQKVEDGTTPVTTPVLSNNPEPTPDPKKDEEIRQRNRENAMRRIENKQWKQKVAALTEDPNIAKEAVRIAAEKRGFKTDTEGNADQIGLMADAIHQHSVSRDRAILETKKQAATETLSATLEALEYNRSSEEFKIVGNMLFQRFGTDNPDVYGDADRMKQEIEDLTSRISRTKKKDPVETAVVGKASQPVVTTESRSAPVADSKAQAKKHSLEWGVSEAKAGQLAEKANKLPSVFRRT